MLSSIKDLKKWYLIFFETGLILALLIVLSAFKVGINKQSTYTPAAEDTDLTILKEIPVTDHKTVPPPPPKPRIFATVPDHQIIEDPVDLSDFTLDNASNMPIQEQRDEKKTDDDPIFVPFEQRPKIIGGYKSVYEKLNYPREAILAGIEGTVIISFIVDTRGNVTNAKVVRGIGGGCDEEALRVVKEMKFKPARQRERYVRIRMNIPIKFHLKN